MPLRLLESTRNTIDSTIDEVVDLGWSGDNNFRSLMKETAAHEAHYGKLDSVNPMQVDDITYENFEQEPKILPTFKALGAKVEKGKLDRNDLKTNIIVGAMKYSWNDKIPDGPREFKASPDQSTRAVQWKKFYNTFAPNTKGTPEKFLKSLEQFNMREEPQTSLFDKISTSAFADDSTPLRLLQSDRKTSQQIIDEGGAVIEEYSPNMFAKAFQNFESFRRNLGKDTDIVGSLKVMGNALTSLPTEIGAAILKAHQGAEGASVTDKGWIQRTLTKASQNQDEFVKEVTEKYKDTKLLPGVPLKITDLAELPGNMAYSISSMLAGLGAGVPVALLPVPGARVAAWATGTAASGKMAYEMSTYEIMQLYLEIKNEEKLKKTGVGLIPQEEKNLKEGFNKEATKYGLWEAIPEALSNLAFGKLLTIPLRKIAGKSIASKMVTKLVGIYGEELLTETITEKGQAPIAYKAGIGDKKELTWTESFKRIAPQTFLLTTIMTGAGSTAVGITTKVKESLKREVKNVDNYKEMEKDIPNLIESIAKGLKSIPKRKAQVIQPFGESLEEGIEIPTEPPKVPSEEPQPPKKAISEPLLAEAKKVEEPTGKPLKVEIGLETGELAIKETTDKFDKMRKRTKTLTETKAVQEEAVTAINESGLEANDKAKFIKAIKNIQTIQQFNNQFPKIQNKIVSLLEASEKRKLLETVKKDLKTTKPIKRGATKVGKYDYTINKIFNNIRELNKLTQEKAKSLLDKFGEPTSEVEEITRRFLGMKSSGMETTLQMIEAVSEDIKTLKEFGQAAKSEQDFEKAVNRKRGVEEVVSAMEKIGGDAKNIKTKAINVYRKGFASPYSMLNSIVGKELAEKYNPELAENARDTEIFFKTKETVEGIANILEVEYQNVNDMLTRMANDKQEITDFDGLVTEISKLEIIDIYNSIKNESTKQSYYDTFGKEQIDRIVSPMSLSEKEMEMADYMQEVIQSYYPAFNERNIAQKGMDLPRVENYWPRSSEHIVDVSDDIRVQGETFSAQKERVRGRVLSIPKNAWLKMQRHISQGEHAKNLSPVYSELKKLFSDRKVKNQITRKFGLDVYNTLQAQIDNISLNQQTTKIDAVTGLIGKMLNNWVTAKVALSPSVFVKQLISVGNYMENMNSGEWVKHFSRGISNPKQTMKYMLRIAPFLEARYRRGSSEAIVRAMNEAEKVGKLKNNWAKAMTSLVRMGDVGAIIYGGYPIIKSELAKHGNLKKAVAKFELATLQAQQSGLASSRSQFQNSKNPFARLLLAFKNTSNQYLRKQADSIISYSNGDISAKQLAKTLAIYSIIQPALYGGSTIIMSSLLYNGFDDDEEWGIKLFTYIATNPFMAIPLIDDLATAAIRKATGQKIWKVFGTPMFDDFENAARKLTKKDVSIFDVLESVGVIGEVSIGAPVKTYTRIIQRLTGTGKKKKSSNLRLLGGSKKSTKLRLLQ